MKKIKKTISIFLSFVIFTGFSFYLCPQSYAFRMTKREMRLLKKAKRMKKSLFKKGNIKERILIKKVMKKFKKLKRRKTARIW